MIHCTKKLGCGCPVSSFTVVYELYEVFAGLGGFSFFLPLPFIHPLLPYPLFPPPLFLPNSCSPPSPLLSYLPLAVAGYSHRADEKLPI